MKRILTIQDISCLGKCSITIALPVISALGTECVILPTAVLSNHTLFKSFTCKDLSDQIEPICEKWADEDIKFDGIYTGYLGTIEQIEMMEKIFDTFGKDALIFVDPVMADNGKLYPAFDMDYAKKNTELCSKADIIVPNITEAAIMTGMEYKEDHDEAYINELINRLVKLGAKKTFLTGVSLSEGDIFSSVLAGAFVLGLNRNDALEIAADYTALTIAETLKNPGNPWYGVDFEATLPYLINMD